MKCLAHTRDLADSPLSSKRRNSSQAVRIPALEGRLNKVVWVDGHPSKHLLIPPPAMLTLADVSSATNLLPLQLTHTHTQTRAHAISQFHHTLTHPNVFLTHSCNCTIDNNSQNSRKCLLQLDTNTKTHSYSLSKKTIPKLTGFLSDV